MRLIVLLQLLPLHAFARQLSMPETPFPAHPQLNGQHFRITTVGKRGYVDIVRDEEAGELKYSGYLIDILRAVSREDRGNFTFDLLTPSGFGSECLGRLQFQDGVTLHSPEAHSERFHTQYKCGESDVNDRPLSAYSTDMYWALYYITTQRLAVNKFTIPIAPPAIGTLGMMGTATGIRNIEDLAANHSHLPVCAFAGTAYIDHLVTSFPTLQVVPISYKDDDVHTVLSNGTCDIIIDTYAGLQDVVLHFSRTGRCSVNGKAIGVIGDPLSYGLNHFAFGVRSDLPDEVSQTLNFWMNALETCFPDDPNSLCSEQLGGGSFSQMFEGRGGSGAECGYVLFPPAESEDPLSPGVIAAIVISPVVLVLALSMLYHMHRLKAQEKRMKKRFIQQLARNIEIGENARDIPPDKLCEAFKHIGGEDEMISKADLARWLNDLHMDFMSEQDFNRLWDTLDMDGRGGVDPVDFISFLSQCGPQFKEVHDEYAALPKSERVKLAARRLSNLSELGEEGVADMERRNNRRSRQAVNFPSKCFSVSSA